MATDKRVPAFTVVRVGRLTTYSVSVPDNADGVAMLDEIGRMFSHRGEYDTAKRIANIVFERKQELRSPTPGEESSTESKQAVPITPPTCRYCGLGKLDRVHLAGHAFKHEYYPEAPASASASESPLRRPVRRKPNHPADTL